MDLHLNEYATVSSRAARYLPEPATKGTGMFLDVINAVRSVASSAVRSYSGMSSSISPEYMDLLQQQIELQKEMQALTMASNIEKTTHESRMAPIRNMRMG